MDSHVFFKNFSAYSKFSNSNLFIFRFLFHEVHKTDEFGTNPVLKIDEKTKSEF